MWKKTTVVSLSIFKSWNKHIKFYKIFKTQHGYYKLIFLEWVNQVFLIVQLVKNPPAMQDIPVQLLSREDPLEKGLDTTPVFLGFPWGSPDKEPICYSGDLGSIPGLGRSPGEGNGYPLQYSGLENSKDCIVHSVTKSRTRLNNFHFPKVT